MESEIMTQAFALVKYKPPEKETVISEMTRRPLLEAGYRYIYSV
jgi:hypothetical protein